MGAFDHDDAAGALRRILPILDRIEQGALFCMDRRFPWTIDLEDREGRALVAEAFAAFPELAAMMPERAAKLAAGALLGDASFACEIEQARKAFGVRKPRGRS